MQYDTDGVERVVCYQSRQLQSAKRKYPVHDKELLAMKYALGVASNATRAEYAPATFNRCVTNLLRSVREFVPSYFDDVFVHSRAMDGQTDSEVH